MVVAESADGFRFVVRPEIVEFEGIESVRDRIYHVYDARITRLDGAHYVMFAMDMDSGCQLGLARTEDFREFRFLGVTSTDDVRNGVLFPGKDRRPLPPARAAQQGQARGRPDDGKRDLAGRIGRPHPLAAARPRHRRPLPLLGRVHRFGAAAGQDAPGVAPRLSRGRDALRQRQYLPGRGRPARPPRPDQGPRPVAGRTSSSPGSLRARPARFRTSFFPRG